MKITILVCLFCLLLASYLEARIINVPDDFETIRLAINASDDGDTVLVQPDTYVENIYFRGRDIVVASLFLTTGDEDFIAETIIDGDESGSVVNFGNEETEEAAIIGFTIRNGSAENGGGVYCYNANPTISNCVITDNSASRFPGGGGGIYCLEADPIITCCIIRNNESRSCGGGFYFSESNPVIDYCVIYGNTAVHASVFEAYLNSNIIFTNCTITGNSDERPAWCYFYGNVNCFFNNCIIWDNVQDEALLVTGFISFTFTDYEGGRDNINDLYHLLQWGEGNIDEDPLFVNADEGDYHLTEDSPCIDAGDPESPEDLDDTRVDMGAYPFLRFFAVLQGFVRNLEDNSPLTEVTVATSHGFSAQTDEDGFWQIDSILSGNFDITAHKTGYIDSTLIDFQINPADTVEVIFQLRHPEFTPSVEELDAELELGDSTRLDFTVRNNGNGSLTWSVERRMRGAVEPWEIIRSYQFGQEVNDSELRTVAFINDQFWITNCYNVVYIFNREGQLVNEPRNLGRVLGWDGEFIWMVRSQNVFSMNLDGEINESWGLPFEVIDGIWDGDRNLFWLAGENLDYISGFDRDGNSVERLECQEYTVRGLSYWSDDPDDYQLYISYRDRQLSRCLIYRMDPDSNDELLLRELVLEGYGILRGSFISGEYDPYRWVFMSIINVSPDGGGDRLDVWQLVDRTDWMELEPTQGTIDPNNSEEFTLTLTTVGIDTGFYEGELVFKHNNTGGETCLPVNLTVVLPNIVITEEAAYPAEFNIIGAYPNPFNSTMQLQFSIPEAGLVEVAVFDLNGRLVVSSERWFESGLHQAVWHAEGRAAGTYLLHVKAGGQARTRKLLLIK